jgi:hypothetical protein
MADQPTLEELEAAFGQKKEAQPTLEELHEAFGQEEPKIKEGILPQVGAFVSGVGQTIPFAKDIAAGANVLRSELGGKPAGVPEQGTLMEKFNAAKEAQMRAQEILGKHYPKTQMAGTGVGIGAQLMMPMSPITSAGARFAEAAPALLKVPAKAVGALGAGAAEGALYGAGEGVTPEERLQSAKTGALFGTAASAAAPVVAAAARPIAEKVGLAQRNIPNIEELKKLGSEAYDKAHAAGLEFRPDQVRSLYNDITSSLKKEGFDPELHKEIRPALNKLYEKSLPSATGTYTPTTLQDLDVIRQLAGDATQSLDKGNRRIGREFRSSLDRFFDNLNDKQYWTGKPEEAIPAITEARKYWHTMRKAEDLENMAKHAENMATNRGADPDMIFRNKIVSELARNEKRPRGWTSEEIAAMKNAINPAYGAANKLREFGAYTPKLMTIGAGLAGEAGLFGEDARGLSPYLLGAGVAGMGARGASKFLNRQAIQHLHNLVRSGGKGALVPRSVASPKTREALIRGSVEYMGDEDNREGRATGGKVAKKDYPAKRLTRLERAARRAFNEIANETKPLMDLPDEQIVNALDQVK